MERKLNLSTISQILENPFDMHIPPDITFKILENGVEYEVEAHKMLLGMVSPVFHRMFFVVDTKDMHAKELPIKGTTRGAFTTMKNAIYGIKSMKDGLKDKSVNEVFAILDLVTRYQIPEQIKVVRNHLSTFSLTRYNVLGVFTVAIKNISTFEKEAQELLVLCARFKDKSVHDVFAILEAVTRYQIPKVREVIGNHLHFIPITLNTVLKVAAVARDHASTFEREARNLKMYCAKFLYRKDVLNLSVQSLHDMLGDNPDNIGVFRDLLEIMATKKTKITEMLKTLNNYRGTMSRSPIGPPTVVHNSNVSHFTGDGVSSSKSVDDLSKKLDKTWEGGLILKNSMFHTRFLLTEGDATMEALMKDENEKPYMKITQRLRMDQGNLDDVSARINSSSSHAIFLAVDASSASVPVAEGQTEIQSRPLRNLVISLQQKEAAGVISLQQKAASGVLYCFPPSEFSTELLRRVAKEVTDEGNNDDYLVVVVVRGGQAITNA